LVFKLIPFRKEKIIQRKWKWNRWWLVTTWHFRKRLFNEFDKEGYTNFEMKINFAQQ
jgi:hypothetical protein